MSNDRVEVQKRMEDIRARLLGEDISVEELTKLQVQIDAIEKWKRLTAGDDHDHDQGGDHDHVHKLEMLPQIPERGPIERP
jgi:hypothetical protein